MINLIESYINILSLDKMNSFLKQNDIILNNEESSFLINYIKENWYQLIYKPDKHLDIIKENISYNNYNKLYELYIRYKKQYINYL